jgi:hypothetical protein
MVNERNDTLAALSLKTGNRPHLELSGKIGRTRFQKKPAAQHKHYSPPQLPVGNDNADRIQSDNALKRYIL